MAQRVAVPGDKRAQVARLTEKGKTEFEKLASHHENWIDTLLDGLSLEDLETLSDTLERVLAQSTEKERADA